MQPMKNLRIEIKAENNRVKVDIIGSISEWGRNNATDLRTRCQELKDAGATQCHIYMMTSGGDCFQANEIVNILNEIFGSYTAEGGALVASAGTYIGVNAETFEMAKNGQYMIHKPSGYVGGNETEVENYLKLLKNMTTTYYDSYIAKLKKPEAEFLEKWNGGDLWLTAKEAVEWGFVTKVKDSVPIDPDTAQAIQKAGSPIAIATTDITHPNNYEMELKALAKSLGLPEDATQEQVNAKLADNARKAQEFDTLKAETQRKEKEQRAASIKAMLDKAEQDKKIKATDRHKWLEQLEKDFEGTKALLETVSPVVKALSDDIKKSPDGKSATYQGKTFEQLQEEDPDLLAELQENNPEGYDALFADYKKRNRIK